MSFGHFGFPGQQTTICNCFNVVRWLYAWCSFSTWMWTTQRINFLFIETILSPFQIIGAVCGYLVILIQFKLAEWGLQIRLMMVMFISSTADSGINCRENVSVLTWIIYYLTGLTLKYTHTNTFDVQREMHSLPVSIFTFWFDLVNYQSFASIACKFDNLLFKLAFIPFSISTDRSMPWGNCKCVVSS